jgi:hypothetical protein
LANVEAVLTLVLTLDKCFAFSRWTSFRCFDTLEVRTGGSCSDEDPVRSLSSDGDVLHVHASILG